MDGRGAAAPQVATARPVAALADRADGGADSSRPAGSQRLAYLDNIKTLLIVGIIAAHAFMGYADFGSWSYQDIQEVTLSPLLETIFVVATVSLGGLFLMALFFLISGLMSQDSLARKGPSRFVRDRLLRLGIPFAIYTLVVWPLLEFLLLEPYLHRGSYWRSFSDTDPVLDNGPMWFVGVLLVYSLGLAAWRRWRPRASGSERLITIRGLAGLALVVGATTFLVRIALPVDSNQPLNSHLWAWPEYLAMFGVGVVAASRGWLREVPRPIARRAGLVTIMVMVLLPGVVLSTEPLGLTEEAWYGGWGVPALLAAMLEGAIAVSAPIWVLAYAQRHLNRTGPLRRNMARSSYAAFMLQGPVLFALELAFRNIELTGDAKALLVAVLGIAGSFALAWPLVTRTPLRRVL